MSEKETLGVKAFRLVNGKLFTGGIGGSIETEWRPGEIVELDSDLPLELCNNGFHFYRKKDACFGANLFGVDTVFYTVKAYGEVVADTEKCVARKIEILEQFELILDGNLNSGDWNSGDWNSGNRNSGNLNSGDWNSGNRNSGNRNSGNLNSGDWNSGNRNSGDWNSGNLNSGDWNSGNWNSGDQNSGDWNSGNRNSGDWNSGNRNSGDWNSGNWNSGHLNSDTPKTIRVFNKNCKREEWESAQKPEFLFFDILDGETYKEAFRRSWQNTTSEDRELLEKLPNFDWDIFTEISGIEKPE